MSGLAVLFRVERIKLRRSWPLLVAILVPCTLVILLGLIFWFSEDRVNQLGPGSRAWYQVSFTVWSLFALPMSLAMMGSLSWEGETQASSWKHLFLQPVPRSAHFASKLMGLLALNLLAHLLLVLSLLCGAWLLRRGAPELQMGPLLGSLLLRLGSGALIASLPICAFHTWLPMRGRGMGLAVIVALLGTWLGFRWGSTMIMGYLLPWGMSCQLVPKVLAQGTFQAASAVGAVLCASLWSVVGFWDFTWRDEPRG